jgi:hypothetical protein
VHVGAGQPLDERILTAFLKQVDACILAYGSARHEFWGDHKQAVDALLTERAGQVERLVATKLAMAKSYFAGRFSGLDPEQVRAMTNEHDLPGINQSLADCPACHSLGVARGKHYIDSDYAYDRKVDIQSGAWVAFNAQSFVCQFCKLQLDTPEQMTEAKMATRCRDVDVDLDEVQTEEEAYS